MVKKTNIQLFAVNMGDKYDLEILHILLEKNTHLLQIIVYIYSKLFWCLLKNNLQ